MEYKKIKVHVVGRSHGYASFLYDYEITDPSNADIAIFTGGEDVNPKLYGASKHPSTYYSERDNWEIKAYDDLIKRDNIKLIVGICRGMQLGCVLNGGLLIQDVDNHAISGLHDMVLKETGERYSITSLHHQMIYPFNLHKENYDIIATSTPRRSTFYSGDLIDPKKVEEEIEMIIFHGEKKLLGIQGHPEMMPITHPTIKMINELIRGLI